MALLLAETQPTTNIPVQCRPWSYRALDHRAHRHRTPSETPDIQPPATRPRPRGSVSMVLIRCPKTEKAISTGMQIDSVAFHSMPIFFSSTFVRSAARRTSGWPRAPGINGFRLASDQYTPRKSAAEIPEWWERKWSRQSVAPPHGDQDCHWPSARVDLGTAIVDPLPTGD